MPHRSKQNGVTWTDMLREETLSHLAHEDDVDPTLQRLCAQAHGAHAHEVLPRLIESAPGREGRPELVCAITDWETRRRPARALLGWEYDVNGLLERCAKSLVVDGAILALTLKSPV